MKTLIIQMDLEFDLELKNKQNEIHKNTLDSNTPQIGSLYYYQHIEHLSKRDIDTKFYLL